MPESEFEIMNEIKSTNFDSTAVRKAAEITSLNVERIKDVFDDRIIKCVDCGEEFVWTAGEQTFFHDKGLQNEPKRCKPCKQAKNERLAAIVAAQTTGLRQRIEVAVSCAQCGQSTTVPFYPSQGRPVFCRACFNAQREAAPSSSD